jgi:hypothetical protein
MTIPNKVLGFLIDLSPKRLATTTPNIGTVAISKAVRPEEICLPASVINHQGITISITAKNKTHFQCFRAIFSAPEFRASGTIMAAPISTLIKIIE